MRQGIGLSKSTWPRGGLQVFFDQLAAGTPLTDGFLLGHGTYEQALGTNQTDETVQTSASTILSWAFAANRPRIMWTPNGNGLVIEPQRRNYVPSSNPLDGAVWTDVGVVVTAAAVGPNGVAGSAARVTTGAGANLRQIANQAIGAGDVVCSAWMRSAGGGVCVYESFAGVPFTNILGAGGNIAAYQRFSLSRTGTASTENSVSVSDARGFGTGSPAAGPRDGDYAYTQIERGIYSTNAIPTAGGLVADRFGCRASWIPGQIVRGGQASLYMRMTPHGAATEYTSNDGAAQATARFWTKTNDPTTYVEMDTATRLVTCSVAGVTRVAANPLAWNAGDLLEVMMQVGGGASYFHYRVNGGAPQDAAIDPTVLGQISASSGRIALMTADTVANGLVLSGVLHRAQYLAVPLF